MYCQFLMLCKFVPCWNVNWICNIFNHLWPGFVGMILHPVAKKLNVNIHFMKILARKSSVWIQEERNNSARTCCHIIWFLLITASIYCSAKTASQLDQLGYYWYLSSKILYQCHSPVLYFVQFHKPNTLILLK
jgi:hypothetical protein